MTENTEQEDIDMERLYRSWMQLPQEERDRIISEAFDAAGKAVSAACDHLPVLGGVFMIGYPTEDHFILHHSRNTSADLAATTAANFVSALSHEDEDALEAFAQELGATLPVSKLEALLDELEQHTDH